MFGGYGGDNVDETWLPLERVLMCDAAFEFVEIDGAAFVLSAHEMADDVVDAA